MSADLRPTQGTVILHITFAAKQDQVCHAMLPSTVVSSEGRSSLSYVTESSFAAGLVIVLV